MIPVAIILSAASLYSAAILLIVLTKWLWFPTATTTKTTATNGTVHNTERRRTRRNHPRHKCAIRTAALCCDRDRRRFFGLDSLLVGSMVVMCSSSSSVQQLLPFARVVTAASSAAAFSDALSFQSRRRRKRMSTGGSQGGGGGGRVVWRNNNVPVMMMIRPVTFWNRNNNNDNKFRYPSILHWREPHLQRASCGSGSLRRHSTFLPSNNNNNKGDDDNNNNNSLPKEKNSTTTTNTISAKATSPLLFETQLLDVRRQFAEATSLYEANQQSASVTMAQLRERISDLEQEQSQPHFWDEVHSTRAATVHSQLSEATRLYNRLRNWEQWHGDAQAALEMLSDLTNHNNYDRSDASRTEREMLWTELQGSVHKLATDCAAAELEWLLSGPYDHAPARLTLTAGAGGTEANDWVADLVRMYQRYCDRSDNDYVCAVLDTSPGDLTGYKSVELLITGHPRPYGWWHGEKGAHRLVRLSPFNANNKRQTTFAGVDVAPELPQSSLLLLADVHIADSELEITTMRAGGKGGQNVNKVNSAVRIKHLPSGLQVKCTQERSQVINKEIAMNRLKAQLLAVAQEQRVQEIRDIRGDVIEASWGAQIRNYVLHPYKQIKDPRTGWETSHTQAFLDGELLDDCIGAYLRYKAAKERQETAEANINR